MVYLFHVVEEKTQKSVSFFKREDKDRADELAASDQGSYFEQKLIALDEEEQSRWDNETVSASKSKIEIISSLTLLRDLFMSVNILS